MDEGQGSPCLIPLDDDDAHHRRRLANSPSGSPNSSSQGDGVRLDGGSVTSISSTPVAAFRSLSHNHRPKGTPAGATALSSSYDRYNKAAATKTPPQHPMPVLKTGSPSPSTAHEDGTPRTLTSASLYGDGIRASDPPIGGFPSASMDSYQQQQWVESDAGGGMLDSRGVSIWDSMSTVDIGGGHPLTSTSPLLDIFPRSTSLETPLPYGYRPHEGWLPNAAAVGNGADVNESSLGRNSLHNSMQDVPSGMLASDFTLLKSLEVRGAKAVAGRQLHHHINTHYNHPTSLLDSPPPLAYFRDVNSMLETNCGATNGGAATIITTSDGSPSRVQPKQSISRDSNNNNPLGCSSHSQSSTTTMGVVKMVPLGRSSSTSGSNQSTSMPRPPTPKAHKYSPVATGSSPDYKAGSRLLELRGSDDEYPHTYRTPADFSHTPPGTHCQHPAPLRTHLDDDDLSVDESPPPSPSSEPSPQPHRSSLPPTIFSSSPSTLQSSGTTIPVPSRTKYDRPPVYDKEQPASTVPSSPLLTRAPSGEQVINDTDDPDLPQPSSSPPVPSSVGVNRSLSANLVRLRTEDPGLFMHEVVFPCQPQGSEVATTSMELLSSQSPLDMPLSHSDNCKDDEEKAVSGGSGGAEQLRTTSPKYQDLPPVHHQYQQNLPPLAPRSTTQLIQSNTTTTCTATNAFARTDSIRDNRRRGEDVGAEQLAFFSTSPESFASLSPQSPPLMAFDRNASQCFLASNVDEGNGGHSHHHMCVSTEDLHPYESIQTGTQTDDMPPADPASNYSCGGSQSTTQKHHTGSLNAGGDVPESVEEVGEESVSSTEAAVMDLSAIGTTTTNNDHYTNHSASQQSVLYNKDDGQSHDANQDDSHEVFPTSPLAIDISATSSNAHRVLSRTTDIRPTVNRLRRTLSAPTRRTVVPVDRESILKNIVHYDEKVAHYESDRAAIIRHVLTQPHLLNDLSTVTIKEDATSKSHEVAENVDSSLMIMFLERESNRQAEIQDTMMMTFNENEMSKHNSAVIEGVDNDDSEFIWSHREDDMDAVDRSNWRNIILDEPSFKKGDGEEAVKRGIVLDASTHRDDDPSIHNTTAATTSGAHKYNTKSSGGVAAYIRSQYPIPPLSATLNTTTSAAKSKAAPRTISNVLEGNRQVSRTSLSGAQLAVQLRQRAVVHRLATTQQQSQRLGNTEPPPFATTASPSNRTTMPTRDTDVTSMLSSVSTSFILSFAASPTTPAQPTNTATTVMTALNSESLNQDTYGGGRKPTLRFDDISATREDIMATATAPGSTVVAPCTHPLSYVGTTVPFTTNTKKIIAVRVPRREPRDEGGVVGSSSNSSSSVSRDGSVSSYLALTPTATAGVAAASSREVGGGPQLLYDGDDDGANDRCSSAASSITFTPVEISQLHCASNAFLVAARDEHTIRSTGAILDHPTTSTASSPPATPMAFSTNAVAKSDSYASIQFQAEGPSLVVPKGGITSSDRLGVVESSSSTQVRQGPTPLPFLVPTAAPSTPTPLSPVAPVSAPSSKMPTSRAAAILASLRMVDSDEDSDDD